MNDPQTGLNLGASAPLVTPLFQSAVYSIPSLDACDAIYAGQPGYIYARDAHPNARRLGALLAAEEGAAWGVVTSSGMAALSALMLPFLQSGDRILASNRLYGRTNQLFNLELARFGVTTQFVDCNDLEAVAVGLSHGPKILLVETISNPLLRVVDIPALAKQCRAAECLLVVDNTFASPAVCRPLELGADLVMESLTKIISGHSDVTLGLIAGNDPELLPRLAQTVTIWGFASNPFDCWLTERGLETMRLRVNAACANAQKAAMWLGQTPGVSRVLYPGCPIHPDHRIAQQILRDGFGHMLAFELAEGREAVNRFIRQAPGIPFCPSLGHTSTTLSHPASTSHRSSSPADRLNQGITDGLIRLSVGSEPWEVLESELRKGLAQ